jgi:hypothetical protein
MLATGFGQLGFGVWAGALELDGELLVCGGVTRGAWQ